MHDLTIRSIDQLPTGPHGVVRLAGAELGVRSFGLQVLELPPGFEHYPEHDHADDGQEEVYVVLRGAADFIVDGEHVIVEAEQIVRIGPSRRRKLVPGPDGARILTIGRAADGPYVRPEHFRVGSSA